MVARVSLWLRKKIVAAAMGVCDEPPGPRLTPPPPFLTDLLFCRLLYLYLPFRFRFPLPPLAAATAEEWTRHVDATTGCAYLHCAARNETKWVEMTVTRLVDPSSGRAYLHNSETGETTWCVETEGEYAMAAPAAAAVAPAAATPSPRPLSVAMQVRRGTIFTMIIHQLFT